MNAFWLNSLLVEKLSIFLQWLGVILVLSGSSVVTAQTAQQIYNINLPTLTVAEALTSLSEQTGVPVFFSYDLVKNQTSNPVKGKYTALDALRLLLRNTRFTGSLSKGGVLMITDSNMTRTNDKQTNGRETSAMNTKKKSLSGVNYLDRSH